MVRQFFADSPLENQAILQAAGFQVFFDEITLEGALGLPTGHHVVENHLGFGVNDRQMEIVHINPKPLGFVKVVNVADVECGKAELANDIDVDSFDSVLGELLRTEVALTAGILVIGLSGANEIKNLGNFLEAVWSYKQVKVVEVVDDSLKEKAEGASKGIHYIFLFEALCNLEKNRFALIVVGAVVEGVEVSGCLIFVLSHVV